MPKVQARAPMAHMLIVSTFEGEMWKKANEGFELVGELYHHPRYGLAVKWFAKDTS